MQVGFYLSPCGTQIVELVGFYKFKIMRAYFVNLFDGVAARVGIIYEPINMNG